MTGLVKSESLCFDSLTQGRVFFCKHKIGTSCGKTITGGWGGGWTCKNISLQYLWNTFRGFVGFGAFHRGHFLVCVYKYSVHFSGLPKIGKTSGLSSREGSFFWQLRAKHGLKAWAHIWKDGDRNIIYRTENQWNPFGLFKLQNKRSGV